MHAKPIFLYYDQVSCFPCLQPLDASFPKVVEQSQEVQEVEFQEGIQQRGVDVEARTCWARFGANG